MNLTQSEAHRLLWAVVAAWVDEDEDAVDSLLADLDVDDARLVAGVATRVLASLLAKQSGGRDRLHREVRALLLNLAKDG